MIPDYMDRKHDYSFARDRQLQNKLLAADDIFDQSQLTSTVVNAHRPSNLRDFKGSEVTGWYPDDKVVLRRADNDNVLSKPRTSVGTREGLLTRDRSRRDLHDSSYAFYHYPESHRYIEQYRREHTCTDSTNSATTRNEFLELQRFYAYRSQTGSLYTHPTTVGYVPQSHAAARREQTVLPHRNSDPSLRSASRYKLSPSFHVRSEQDLSKEIDQTEPGPLQVGANTGSSSKMAIHAISKTPIPKVPTKVTVPTNQSMISASLNKSVKAGRKTGSPKTTSVAAWENGVGTMRTLDTLACVARPGDKTQGNLAWLTIQVAAPRKDSSEVGLSAGHWAHVTEQSAPPTPERDRHPAHFSSPGQILVDHGHGAICPSERVHSPWEAFHRIPQEGDTSHAAEPGRHPGEALQSPKKHLPTVSSSKAPASTFSSSSVRNLSSLSSTFSSAPSPKWESKASPPTGVPTGLMSSADGSRMLGDVASRPFHSKGMWNVSRGPFRGSREKLLQRMQAAALSMVQGESREQAAREPRRWDISTPLSVLSIRSARKREGSRGQLVLVERSVTLAPTRPGCGRDHTDIDSRGTGGNDGQGGEDRVPWQDCGEDGVPAEDMDSSPLESGDSSLEVIISSQEDVGQNEDSVGQEDLNSSREQQGPHRGVTRLWQEGREDCSHTVDGKSVDFRRGHCSSQRSNDCRHDTYIHNRRDLQIVNMRPSGTTNPALSEQGGEDTLVEQHTFDEGDATETDSATSISQKTSHKPITSLLTSRVHDGNFPLGFPPQPSHTQFSIGAAPQETGPILIQGQSFLNPHPADLNDTTEDGKREIDVSQDTQRPQQQTGAAVQTYTPIHQQGAASEDCHIGSHGLQGPSSLCRDVPNNIQESLAKCQPPNDIQESLAKCRPSCTFLQDAGHVEREEQTTAPCTHSSPDGEDPTMLTGGESSGFFGSSGSCSSRHTQALSRLQRQRTAMMKASHSSLHAVSSPRQHGSPRKGVPFPGPHRGALLVYHNDVNRMMVVGSQCTHRPSTSLSHTPFPAESDPASRSSLVTASRSAGLYRQTRSLRDNH